MISTLSACIVSLEALQGRVQLWPELHRGGHRPHAPGQAVHDEPRPGGVLRLLVPQPGVCTTCLGQHLYRILFLKYLTLEKVLEKENLFETMFLSIREIIFSMTKKSPLWHLVSPGAGANERRRPGPRVTAAPLIPHEDPLRHPDIVLIVLRWHTPTLYDNKYSRGPVEFIKHS